MRGRAGVSSTTSGGLTAKCQENQAALDRLVRERERMGDSKYSFSVKRAIESLMKCQEPITTYQQALKLPYVGPVFAKKIAPDDEAPPPCKRSRKQPPTASTASSSAPSTSAATTTKRRRRPTPAALDNSKKTTNAAENGSAKDRAYEKAKAQALDWRKSPALVWKVMLLVDGRERQSNHIQAKCSQSGIPCEERHLPIGDMAWIAQGFVQTDYDKAKNKGPHVELMLGTIVERKTTEDLKASLFGTRYWEQRLRLQHSGLPQVLFLIEGDLNKELFRCPADTLHTAVWETRLHLGFQIVQTAHMDDTVRTLKRMHRRILQRTFPRAFQDEALPTFAEAERRRQSRGGRRRRIQSLVEMTFDVDPTPPLGTERFITYQELKAKILRDREAGTRTVGKIHMAMLKQVPTFSSKKCHAVARVYPTAGHLLAAYDQAPDRQTLVADLVHEDRTTSRDVRIGPRSAAELHIAYGLADEEDEQLRSGIQVLGSQPSTGTNYGALEQRVEETQERTVQPGQNISGEAHSSARKRKRKPRKRQVEQSDLGFDSDEQDINGLDSDGEEISGSGGGWKQSSSFGESQSPLKENIGCVDLTTATSPATKTSSPATKGFLDMSWDTSMDITPARFAKPTAASNNCLSSDNSAYKQPFARALGTDEGERQQNATRSMLDLSMDGSSDDERENTALRWPAGIPRGNLKSYDSSDDEIEVTIQQGQVEVIELD